MYGISGNTYYRWRSNFFERGSRENGSLGM
ncbi:hypothetical protein B2G51_03675 [Leptospira santarosai]|nr:hypothetical protein B2G51_03675 [Leptospira santarosai]